MLDWWEKDKDDVFTFTKCKLFSICYPAINYCLVLCFFRRDQIHIRKSAMQTGHFRPCRYLSSPWLPLELCLKSGCCSLCPHLPFSSHRLLANFPLPSLSHCRFLCPPFHSDFPQPLAFLLSLFTFLIVTDIFYTSFWTMRFPSSLLPILSFRALFHWFLINFLPVTQFACSHLTLHCCPTAQRPI